MVEAMGSVGTGLLQVGSEVQDAVVETTGLVLQLEDAFVFAFLGGGCCGQGDGGLCEQGLTDRLQLLKNFLLEDLQISSLLPTH
jgi:hypothetical protein